jgi:PAS domain-containing protein
VLLTGLGLAVAGTEGLLPPPAFHNSPLATWADFAVYTGLIVAFQLLAARNLRASESRYHSLVDRARDVIFTVSREGRITSLNPAFEAVTGLEAAEWVGRPFAALVASDRAEEIWAALRQTSGPALEVPVRGRLGQRVLEVVLAMSPDASADSAGHRPRRERAEGGGAPARAAGGAAAAVAEARGDRHARQRDRPRLQQRAHRDHGAGAAAPRRVRRAERSRAMEILQAGARARTWCASC